MLSGSTSYEQITGGESTSHLTKQQNHIGVSDWWRAGGKQLEGNQINAASAGLHQRDRASRSYRALRSVTNPKQQWPASVATYDVASCIWQHTDRVPKQDNASVHRAVGRNGVGGPAIQWRSHRGDDD